MAKKRVISKVVEFIRCLFLIIRGTLSRGGSTVSRVHSMTWVMLIMTHNSKMNLTWPLNEIGEPYIAMKGNW